MADFIVVRNPELFILFRTSSHIFGTKNTSEFTIFYWLNTSGFNTEAV